MADEFGNEEAPPPAAAQSPAVETFRDAFTEPVAKEWSGEVAARLNDYFTRRQIADDNAAAGERFVNNLDDFKSGLVKGVQSDPFFVHTALDIVPSTLDAFAAAMPNAPEDVAAHNEALGQHIQGEIATAAVTRLAEMHEGAARGMLADERIKTVLGEATGPLDQYIRAQAGARQVDREAQVSQQRAQAALAANNTAVRYLSALYDPSSGSTTFPDKWNQSVLADSALPPPIKVGVIDTYARLQTGGDIERSDPFVITDAIRRAANGEPPPAGEIAGHIGNSLTLADGLSLMRRLSTSPAAHVEAQKLQETLDMVRQQIAPPESGAAGALAYGRFVNWFLPEYTLHGPSSLNPMNPNWLLNPEVPNGPMQRFLPNGDDIVRLAGSAQVAMVERQTRPSLASIFNGTRSSGDRMPRQYAAPEGYHYDAGGNLVPTQVEVNPKGPFYGKAPLTNDQAINPAGTDRDAAGHLLTEIRTDSGIKALTRQEIAASTTAPRPVAAPALTDEQQQTFQDTGKIPDRGATRPRGRRGRR